MKKLALMVLTLPFIISCEKDAFNERYEFIYGSWTPTKVDTWFITDLKSYGNTFQFIKDHQYKIFRNDTLLERGTIDITEQTETNLTIRFVTQPKDMFYVSEYKQINRSPLIVTVLSPDSIRVGNLATDGGAFCLWLSKKKY